MLNRLLLLFFVFLTLQSRSQELEAGPADSVAVSALPLINEQQFSNFNALSKERLDAIINLVPLTYNEYVQHYIDIYTSPSRKSMFADMLGRSAYYFPIFEKALKTYNIPDEIKYLPVIESSMDPLAVSKHGATGLWQFMAPTAKGYGLQMDAFEDQRRDPIQASYAAAAYFRDAYEEFGDWLLSVAAYNCGMGNVKRAIAKAGSQDFWTIRPYLPLETRNYVPAFIAALYTMRYAGDHQITAKSPIFAFSTDTILVNRPVSLDSLAGAMEVSVDLLKALNPAYKLRYVNASADKVRRIVLPRADGATFTAIFNVLEYDAPMPALPVVRIAAAGRSKPKPKPATRHTVRSGENLSVIAEKYAVSVDQLKKWNDLKTAQIRTGQQLNIKAGTAKATGTTKDYVTYKVKKGDTLSEIAEKFDGATVGNIRKDNNLNNAKLQEGMLLKIFRG